MSRPLVIIESPYAGDVERNLRYARACVADSLRLGEAPFASHLLYTQAGVLDDKKYDERLIGMEAGWAWMERCDFIAIYMDLGWSPGMKHGRNIARGLGKKCTYRLLDGEWKQT